MRETRGEPGLNSCRGGGSAMFLAGIHHDGKTDLVIVPGNLTAQGAVTELSSLLLYRICNNITLGFSNMIMPVHRLRGIPRTFYASITSMCCSGLQDHRISIPLSTCGTT